MVETVWKSMPQDLVERVLFCLPFCHQVRFRTVCKRWKELMASVAFRKETLFVAFRLGYPLQALVHRCGAVGKELKAHVMNVPGLKLLREHMSLSFYRDNVRVFGHADLVGLACWTSDGKFRCFVLNLANQTWQELPPLGGLSASPGSVWRIWLAGGSTGFQVSFMAWAKDVPHTGSLYTYSSTSTNWQRIAALFELRVPDPLSCAFSKGGHVVVDGEGRVWRWEGNSVTPLPKAPPQRKDCKKTVFLPLSSPEIDAVFGYHSCPKHVKLYKLDESTWPRGWKCVISGLAPGYHDHGHIQPWKIEKAQIVGHRLLMNIQVCTTYFDSKMGKNISNHILNECWKWLHPLEPGIPFHHVNRILSSNTLVLSTNSRCMNEASHSS